jgi:heme-degrading monooxygenase HmoA
MVIGEALSEEQVREFTRIYTTEVLPQLKDEMGFETARLGEAQARQHAAVSMVEEGGRMAVSLTVWKTRGDCLKYHSSRAYRQLVARTQHLLVGDFVVKLFKDCEG